MSETTTSVSVGASASESPARFGVGPLPPELNRPSVPAFFMPGVIALGVESWGWFVVFIILSGTGQSLVDIASVFDLPMPYHVSIRVAAGATLGLTTLFFAFKAHRLAWERASQVKKLPLTVVLGGMFASLDVYLRYQRVLTYICAALAAGGWVWVFADAYSSDSGFDWTVVASMIAWAVVIGIGWIASSWPQPDRGE